MNFEEMEKESSHHNTDLELNALCLGKELEWFNEILILRGKITFEGSIKESELQNLKCPDFSGKESNYSRLIEKHQMGFGERLILILTLIPHIRPSLLDLLHIKNQNFEQPFTEFGGIKAEKHKGFIPTGETAIFLLAGSDLSKRFDFMKIFQKDHYFSKNKILCLDRPIPGEPKLSGALQISPEYLSLLTTGELYKPDFDLDFQAKRISST